MCAAAQVHSVLRTVDCAEGRLCSPGLLRVLLSLNELVCLHGSVAFVRN